MRVVTDILNYRQWRVVCDHCDWSSPNTDRLSDAVKEMNGHREVAHQPVCPSRPAPIRPSQVLANVTPLRYSDSKTRQVGE